MGLRTVDAFPYVNAAFAVELSNDYSVKYCRLCYGGIHPDFTNAVQTERLSIGQILFSPETMHLLIRSLYAEIQPIDNLEQTSPVYRKHMAISLFYRFILNICPPEIVSHFNRSGSTFLRRPLSCGIQTFSTNKSKWPLTRPINKYEGLLQCTGEVKYSDDLPPQKDELWAAFVYATRVHFSVAAIDASEALRVPGVRYFISANDITGKNTIIPPYKDLIPEKLFLDIGDRVQFHGQPVGILLAESMSLANESTEKVQIVYVNEECKSSF